MKTLFALAAVSCLFAGCGTESGYTKPIAYSSYMIVTAHLNCESMDQYVTLAITSRYSSTDPKTADDGSIETYSTSTNCNSAKKSPFSDAAWHEKEEEIKQWVVFYLADKTKADFRGSENLNKLKTEIRDGLSKTFWPNSEKYLLDIIITECLIQNTFPGREVREPFVYPGLGCQQYNGL